MRKLIVLCLVWILCLPVTAYALSVGNAETQGKGRLALGLEDEYVPHRDLKSFSKSETVDSIYLRIKKPKPELDEMFRKMLKISYGLFDGLDIYGKIGLSDFEVKDGIGGTWRDESTGEEGLLGGSFRVDSGPALTYGGGIQANLNIGNNWLIGTDAQYLRHRNNVIGPILIYAGSNDPIRWSARGEMTVQEWHGALYLARKVENFTPYLGAKYSDLRMKLKYHHIKFNEGDSDDFDAKNRFGFFLGTDIKVGGNAILNLEGRFIDENAASMRITFRF